MTWRSVDSLGLELYFDAGRKHTAAVFPWRYVAARPYNAVDELHACGDMSILTYDAILAYLCAGVNLCAGVDAVAARGIKLVLEVGLGGANLIPVAPIVDGSCHVALSDEFNPKWDDGEFLRFTILECWEVLCDAGVNDVDARELIAASIDVQGVANVGDQSAGGVKAYVFVAINTAQGKRDGLAAFCVGGEHFVQRYVGDDVSVLDDERLIFVDEGEDFLDAAARVEWVFFVAEVNGATAVASFGEGALPEIVEIGDVDDESAHTRFVVLIHDVLDKCFLMDGDEGLWQDAGQWGEACAMACGEDE